MTKAITKEDVWLALFSLDSYHRGYGQQVYTSARSSTHLGNARIVSQDISGVAESAGFYAISYDVSSVTDLGDANTDLR